MTLLQKFDITFFAYDVNLIKPMISQEVANLPPILILHAEEHMRQIALQSN